MAKKDEAQHGNAALAATVEVPRPAEMGAPGRTEVSDDWGEQLFRLHPSSQKLSLELHARPYEPFEPEGHVSHICLYGDDDMSEKSREHVAALCRAHDVAPPAAGAKHFVADLGPFRLKWTRHTEYTSVALFREHTVKKPFAQPAIDLLPQEWIKKLPGEVLVATEIAVMPCPEGGPNRETLDKLFDSYPVMGARVAGGAASVFTDFRMQYNGFHRFLVWGHGLKPDKTGRLIQRLLDFNAYRMLALLALPVAQEAGPKIEALDRKLALITRRMADPHETTSDADLLEELSRIATESDDINASTSSRFSAARAYDQIVGNLLTQLRQERIEPFQTLSEFLERRFRPAMFTCRAVEERQADLSQRAARITNLLRARVQVQEEQQQKEVMHTMARRAKLQVKLQNTVEGLSVVAISYYLVGLANYVLKALADSGTGIDATLGTGIAVPVVLLAAWFGIKRIRAEMMRRHGAHDKD